MEEGGVGSVTERVDLFCFKSLFNGAIGFMDMGAVGELALRSKGDKIGEGEENFFGVNVINAETFNPGSIYTKSFVLEGDEFSGCRCMGSFAGFFYHLSDRKRAP